MLRNIPTTCIYHSPCPDGFSAAWAVWKKYGDQVRYYPAVHGDPPPDMTNEHVLFVDFSYKADVLKVMAAQAASVTVLDHHRTAEAGLSPLLADGTIDGLFDMTRSGAVITWNYLHPYAPVPKFLLHIQDRDLWEWKLSHSREILASVEGYDYSFDNWSMLAEAVDDQKRCDRMIEEGKAVVRTHEKQLREMLKNTTRTMGIGGIEVPVANLPYMMASDGAGTLAQDAPFAASYYDRSTKRVFSLRSRKDGADVSAIAQQYGGGGHYHAAGFERPLAWEGDEVASK
jgi:oligoribonuclease NrnB/cAMP/cGMP phosphodiesterase (DHH superfamily)